MYVFHSFFRRIRDALSSELGWFLTLITSAFVSNIDVKLGVYVVLGAVLADLFWGVWAAIKLKQFIFSVAFRETFKKGAIYFFVLAGAFSIEFLIKAESNFIAYKTFVVLISACELWSMSASMLIVKPNTPFLKIMRGQLKGEIQSKINKNIDLDKILKDDTTDNPTTT